MIPLRFKLEDRQLIAREQGSEDRRVVMVRMTDEGRKQVESSEEGRKMDSFSVLSEDEKKTLSDLLDKLIRGSDAKQAD